MKSLKKFVLAPLLTTTVLSGITYNVSAETVTEDTLEINEARANNPAYSEEAITENDGFLFDEDGNLVAVTIGGETTLVHTYEINK